MKSKLIKWVICTFVIIMLMCGTLANAAPSDAQGIIDDIIACQMKRVGTADVGQWINKGLTAEFDTGSEWYVLALSRLGEYDFGAYRSALEKFLSVSRVGAASSRLKFAFTLAAVGSENEYITQALSNSIGKQGVVSWIWGLIMLNNGYVSEYSVKDCKEKLLSLQKADGGWAVMGNSGDADVTAMALQALAPYYKSDTAVKEAADRALEMLSVRQLDSGEYTGYGVANPESAAQVITALSSLGIDCLSDKRFIKSGTLFDGIGRYRLADGSYCHTEGGEYNAMATVQVFCAMTAYRLMQSGQPALYVLTNKNAETAKKTNSATAAPARSSVQNITEKATAGKKTAVSDVISKAAHITPEPTATDKKGIADEGQVTPTIRKTAEKTEKSAVQINTEGKQSGKPGYKIWAIGATAAAGAVVCLILFIIKKGNKKNYLFAAAITAAVMAFILLTTFETPDQHFAKTAPEKKTGTVTLSIELDEGAEHSDRIILAPCEMAIGQGDTVYDVLVRAAAQNRLQMEASGSGSAVYIRGIGNIYEFDHGSVSGWVYYVNGTKPQVSCGEQKVSAGDRIEWKYTVG